MYRKLNKIAVVVLLITVFTLSASAKSKVKYVFYMIGDGMGFNQVNATQLYNRANGQPDVNFYNFPVATYITTNAANSLVTDSAAAGTALATGTKTVVGRLGNDVNDAPLKSVAAYAKEQGFGVGIITSVGVNHATPGAFYGHVTKRDMYDEIAKELIDTDIDFAAGANFLSHMPDNKGPEYWVNEAKKAGITVYRGHNAYKRTDGRVIYLCDDYNLHDLQYAIDRKEGDTELADFMSAAVDHLYAKYAKKGFFLMCEGGKIDYSSHSNDVVTTIKETNDFANSIEIALEFYRKHPKETVIIVTADHETGGLSIGNGRYELHPEVLDNQKCSINALTSKINALMAENGANTTWEQVHDLLQENLGFYSAVEVSERADGLFRGIYNEMIAGTAAEVKDLYASNSKLANEAIKYFCSKSMFSWISHSHSGSPLGLYVIGASQEAFAGVHDNTEIPLMIEKVAGYRK